MFRLNRNERSHWSGNGVHVESELVFMIGRNMQLILLDMLDMMKTVLKLSTHVWLAGYEPLQLKVRGKGLPKVVLFTHYMPLI